MISIEGLNKVFRLGFFMKEKQAVHDLNLEVNQGEIFGFVGPNGAGKSTTIKILLGLLRKSSGQFSIMGEQGSSAAARSKMGYLPEHPYFYDYLSGRELLNFYGKLLGLKGAELQSRIDWALEMVHANQDWINSKLRSYSKGMMQRVGLAQSILNQPELLILDEPMSGLDPVGRKDVRDTILELNQMGTTVFYSSHVLSDVEAISSNIGIIINGHMRKQGSVHSILSENEPIYHVRVDDSEHKLPSHLQQSPFQELTPDGSGWYECPDVEHKNHFIQWLNENNYSIEGVDRKRPSLEDVLTREIAKNV